MNIQFAVSPHSRDLREIVVNWASSTQESNSSVMAIVEASMLEAKNIKSLLKEHRSSMTSILPNLPTESNGFHGPVLWDVGTQPFHLLQRLIWFSNKKPALSLIKKRENVDNKTLCDFLRWLTLIETEDGLQLCCRYADTRILPGFLDNLEVTQQKALAEVIEAWCWISRDGMGLEERNFLKSSTLKNLEPLNRTLKISDAQYSGILRFAEEDMVCQLIIERMPDLLPNGLSAETHHRMTKILAQARSKGIEDLKDLFEFAVIALSTYDNFSAHPCLEKLWEEYKLKKSSFSQWVADWPENVWLEIENPILPHAN